MAGIEQADSVALDPHKWLHAPFDVGCALVRDAHAHHASFALHPEYLEEHARGIAGAPHLFDYGIELSRSFRALKVWMMLREHGVEAFGRLIAQNIAQAQHLAQRIAAEPALELMAPVATNIVCFRHRLPGAGRSGAEGIQHRDPAARAGVGPGRAHRHHARRPPLAARGDRQPPHAAAPT